MTKTKKPFTEKEKILIKKYIEDGLFNKEIARKLNRPVESISMFARSKLNGNPNYLNKKKKHNHLHQSALNYFQTHSFNETAEYLKLTKNELKSCFSAAYKNKSLSHIRKDNRINHKRFWTVKEIIFMLRASGLLSRKQIATILNRGNSRVIKEKLKKIGISSRNINGINLQVFRNLTGKDTNKFIQSSAGPCGNRGQFFYKIILWSDLEKMIENKEIYFPPVYRKLVKIMALFQRWIWNGGNIRSKINRMLKKYETI